MAKVYILTEGAYEDYTIYRVFSNRKQAELFTGFQIEEYEIEDEGLVPNKHLTLNYYPDYPDALYRYSYYFRVDVETKEGTCVFANASNRIALTRKVSFDEDENTAIERVKKEARTLAEEYFGKETRLE